MIMFVLGVVVGVVISIIAVTGIADNILKGLWR